MMDLISREDALAVVRYSKNAVEGIENLPSVDAVEVVRCKDCRYWEDKGVDFLLGQPFGECSRPLTSIVFDTDPNEFCSSGEKRDVE